MTYAEGTRFPRGSGYHAEVVIRDGHWVVLRCTHQDVTRPTWEVVRVRQHNGFTIAGKQIPPGESLASTSEWGSGGWTYTTREDAERKLGELLDRDARSLQCATQQERS